MEYQIEQEFGMKMNYQIEQESTVKREESEGQDDHEVETAIQRLIRWEPSEYFLG
jgi:hypothetical protein